MTNQPTDDVPGAIADGVEAGSQEMAAGDNQSNEGATSLGVPLDDDGSYPSAMSGTTNANAHTAGVPQGRTDSTRDER